MKKILILLLTCLPIISCDEKTDNNISNSTDKTESTGFTVLSNSTSFNFSLSSDGNVTFNDYGTLSTSVSLYDSSLNAYTPVGLPSNEVNSDSSFLLPAGNYIAQVSIGHKWFEQVSFYSPIITPYSSLNNLEAGTYKGVGVAFYRLSFQNDGNIIVTPQNNLSVNVSIFDSSLNEFIPAGLDDNYIDTGQPIYLQAGSYIVMVELGWQEWTEAVITY